MPRKSWECDFCLYSNKNKDMVIEHEGYCFYNPKNQACPTCAHSRATPDYHEPDFSCKQSDVVLLPLYNEKYKDVFVDTEIDGVIYTDSAKKYKGEYFEPGSVFNCPFWEIRKKGS